MPAEFRFRLFRYFRSFRSFLRSVAGMPDYAAHVEHLRLHHPEAPVPTPRAFYEDYVRSRYGDGPTRCC
jgi:uncharacterized short protein YbdD (DUF466 family)